MSQVAGPYGLRVVKYLGETPISMGMHTYPISAAALTAPPLTTTGIFFGDPVNLTGGSILPLAATPTAGAGGVIGVFQGASWQDPIRGFVNSQFLPAGLGAAGVTNVQVKVSDYPWVVMRVQADGPVQLAQLGFNASLGNFGQGSTQTGNSKVNLASGSIAQPGAALALRIYGFVQDATPSPGAGSTPGDPYTDVLVVWNFGIDRYLNATGG